MSLKHAVLALVVERRGYGYDLVQRFEERVGPGWRLNPSAVYPALDQLEGAGLVMGAPRPGGTRRSPRMVYAATGAGVDALETWMRTTETAPDPVRSDLHLKLAFARPRDRPALLAEIVARERASEQLLARYAAASPRAAADEDWPRLASRLIEAAVVARLQADIAWLRSARAAFERALAATAE